MSTNTLAATSTYPLIIAQFPLVGHPRLTEHWNISALISKEEGRIFELAGNYDTLTYITSTVSLKNIDCSGGFLLCHIPDEKMQWLEELLGTIKVVRGTPDFDCQTWVISALRILQDEGLVPRDVTENGIREELEKEKERWDVADDTIVERIISTLS